MSNIVSYVLNNTQHMDHVAVIGPNQSITYGELKVKVLQACTYFQQVLTPENDRVTIAASDSIAFVVAALGVMAAGGVLTSLPSKGDHSAKLAKINPAMVLTDISITEWYISVQLLSQSVSSGYIWSLFVFGQWRNNWHQ
jgi:acyl-CoA synthetase (AMP-forming)/AMP-acid ligase II